jgi:hypothetical protein
MAISQIHIQNSNVYPNGSYTLSGYFWLTVSSSIAIPNEKFVSQVHNVPSDAYVMLQAGTLLEKQFTTGLFSQGTPTDDVRAKLLEMYANAQLIVDNSSVSAGLVGTFFDGTTWQTTAPLSIKPSVNLGTQYIQRWYKWSDWLQKYNINSMLHRYDDDGVRYTIWFYDGPEVHICMIWKGNVPDSVVNDGYTQQQNDADKQVFESKYKSTANFKLDQKTPDGRLRVSSEKSNVSRYTIYTHNWCDRTTWYSKSNFVDGEVVAFVSGSYQLSHGNIIDTYHGKLTGEDFLKDSNGISYRVKLFASGTQKFEQDPHYGVGGDFTVNYDDGTVTPVSGQFEDPVTVSYHYATTSEFIIKPSLGKCLVLNNTETQFSDDIVINDSVSFKVYGFVEVFAPHLCPVPYPSGTLIHLDTLRYKTIFDFYNEAMRSYPSYPALGGSGWRGTTHPTYIFDWDYVSSQTIYSSKGMELHIMLDHDVPMGGTFGTTTFYFISQDE